MGRCAVDEFDSAFQESTNNDGVPINWLYWVHQMPTLTAAQAARLMSGLDPDIFSNLDNPPNRATSNEAVKQARNIQRLADAESMQSATPGKWMEWAARYKFEVHTLFRIEVEELEKGQKEQGGAVTEKTDVERGVVSANDWIAKARKIADQIGLERWNNGQRQITGRNIAAAVASELAKDESTHGKLGERGEDNVRTVGLKEWKFIPPKKMG